MQCGINIARETSGKDLNDESLNNIGSDEAGIEWKRDSGIHGALLGAEIVEILSDLTLGKDGRDEKGEVEYTIKARGNKQHVEGRRQGEISMTGQA